MITEKGQASCQSAACNDLLIFSHRDEKWEAKKEKITEREEKVAESYTIALAESIKHVGLSESIWWYFNNCFNRAFAIISYLDTNTNNPNFLCRNSNAVS